MFDLALNGRSLRAIAILLAREGIPTPSGRSTTWSMTTVRFILGHAAYAGLAQGWRLQRFKQNGTNRRVVRPESEQIPLPPDAIPTLINAATFQAVAARFTRNKAAALGNNRQPYPALLRAGFVRCGHCG